jgi:hypothetical protein
VSGHGHVLRIRQEEQAKSDVSSQERERERKKEGKEWPHAEKAAKQNQCAAPLPTWACHGRRRSGVIAQRERERERERERVRERERERAREKREKEREREREIERKDWRAKKASATAIRHTNVPTFGRE